MAEEHVSDVSIKVFVDKKKNRIVYAECGGDFVDVLLSFLTTPLGKIISLARSQSLPMEMGCLSNLYTTVENMDVQNFHSRARKTMLLEPRNSAETQCMNLKLKFDDTVGIKDSCPIDPCRGVKIPLPFMDVGGCFVKVDTGFIITDDLQLLCVSSSVYFFLYSKLGIRDVTTLEARSLNVGANEIVNLLVYSFVSKSPLSETFLKCKPAPEFIYPILFPERSIDQSRRVEDLKINQDKSATLKLMISKSKKTVCYAEADKDFVNLLFSFLTVPLGHVVKQIQNGCFNGCVNHLYKSVQYLDEQCFKKKFSAHFLLRPSLALGCWYRNDLLGIEKSEVVINNSASPTDGGFLSGHKLFMVTDKLVIAPISSESCFSILREMKVHFTDIEEKIVKVNRELALRLLVSSFVSESALTNVFVK